MGSTNGNTKGVLVDITRCIDCQSCVVACRLYNGLETGQKGNGSAGLTPDRWTAVQAYHVNKDGTDVRRFVKTQCLHCLEPACANACFTTALYQTPDGGVAYNEKLCVGCRYCQIACPFNILKFEWDNPFPRVLKCQMCLARVADNQMPACVGVCPTEAVTFGGRDDLVKEAKKRQSSSPGLYVEEIYGLKEAGGTSWLYISDVPFEELGFKVGISERSIPSYTWEVLKWTPHIAIGWGAILTGMFYYTKRRSEISHEEADDIFEPVGSD